MSATSFQFRYPLNRNPYISAENEPIIYPYSAWGDFAEGSNKYVYGSRKIPFRSYFGQDVNLTARPISRIVQPSVVQYAPIVSPNSVDNNIPVTVAPTLTLGNRFAALNAGEQQVVPLKLWGAQAGELTQAHQKQALIVALILLAIAVVVFIRQKQ
jgi:hypothetical protein